MDVKLPPLGEGADSGTVVTILVKEGDQITKGQSLIEIETGKAVAPVPSSAAGKIVKVHVKEGGKIVVGQTILTLESVAQSAPPSSAQSVNPPPPRRPAAAPLASTETAPSAPIEELEEFNYTGPLDPPAAPSIRRIARELGLDLRRIPGSAEGGRIVMADLKAYIQSLRQRAVQPRVTPIQSAPATSELPDFSRWGQISRRPLSPLRKVIGQRMAENWNAIPHVTQFEEVDITHIMDLRRRFNGEFEKHGARLTLTPFAIKAVVVALKKFPIFNSSLNFADGELIVKEYYNVGLAVDTEQGLIVPVIKNADKKTMIELSREVNELAGKTRERKVSLDDLQGGTFTISNQGGIGGSHFTPIVNKPEVAILGLGRGALKPVARGQGIEARLMLPLCLSYDHRVVDGGDAVRFVLELVQGFENFPESELKV